jgi:hypothetical protein
MDNRGHRALVTIRKQLGALDRIETLIGDTNTILREIRADVQELAAAQRDS